jgi:hypothetical protein
MTLKTRPLDLEMALASVVKTRSDLSEGTWGSARSVTCTG